MLNDLSKGFEHLAYIPVRNTVERTAIVLLPINLAGIVASINSDRV